MSCNAIDLNRKMSEMPRHFKKFSAELLSLYYEKAPGGGEGVKLFISLRDDVRDQAIIYREGILPAAVKVVTNISKYFDNYRLGFDFWQKNLKKIIEEATKFELACILLTRLHKEIVGTLKSQRSKAEVALVEMNKLSSELEERSSKMESLASFVNLAKIIGWIGNIAGVALAIPTAGASLGFNFGLGAASVAATTACSFALQVQGSKAQAKALAAKRNAEHNTEAGYTTNNLIQAISQFIEGLNIWQKFFSETASELTKFREDGESARKDGESSSEDGESASEDGESASEDGETFSEEDMKFYFQKMELVAKDINASCKEFISSIGDVSTFLKRPQSSSIFGFFLNRIHLDISNRILTKQNNKNYKEEMIKGLKWYVYTIVKDMFIS